MNSVIYVALIFLFGLLMTGGLSLASKDVSNTQQNVAYELVEKENPEAQKTLQLNTLTFKPKPTGCSAKIAVNLLLDNSGSMNEPPRKMQSLKTAVNSFFTLFKTEDIMGVQRFGSNVGDVVPIDTVLNLRPTFASKVNAISPSGSTHIRDGMELSEQKIADGKAKFPDFSTWVLIVVTDGSPNPWPEQDPRSVATRIKQSGVRIITIGIELGTAKEVDAQTARTIMEDVASSPTDFYQPDAGQLLTIYNSIADSICR